MPDYTRLLNASTASSDNDLFAGLYAELKKSPPGAWRPSDRVGRLMPLRWSTKLGCACRNPPRKHGAIAAALLGVNEKTVRRHWELAKIWLYRAMEKKT